MKVVWKEIIGYEDRYMVSNTGIVKSIDRYVLNKLTGNLNFKKSRELYSKHKSGYSQVTLMKDGKPKIYKVHRLVAIHFISNPKNKKFVNHKDGNRSNNHVDNLEWCTQWENNTHKSLNRKSTSKYPGVSFTSSIKKWRAQLRYKGKSYNMGYFDLEEEAFGAVLSKRKEIGIEYELEKM